jgi:hypothetical protein
MTPLDETIKAFRENELWRIAPADKGMVVYVSGLLALIAEMKKEPTITFDDGTRLVSENAEYWDGWQCFADLLTEALEGKK